MFKHLNHLMLKEKLGDSIYGKETLLNHATLSCGEELFIVSCTRGNTNNILKQVPEPESRRS